MPARLHSRPSMPHACASLSACWTPRCANQATNRVHESPPYCSPPDPGMGRRGGDGRSSFLDYTML
eukprot:11056761-Alexandrium_andersonii.AAC.1